MIASANLDNSRVYTCLKVCKNQKTEKETILYGDHSFVLGPSSARSFKALAWSLINILRSFPLGFFGMASTNSTPPTRCLYAALASETC